MNTHCRSPLYTVDGYLYRDPLVHNFNNNKKWRIGISTICHSSDCLFNCCCCFCLFVWNQVSLQDKDSKDIETIIDEIENFQKLRSDYIVKFYGAEVHHVSVLDCNTTTA